MTYTYIVWVGGVDDYYVNYSDAKRDYDYWISQGYDDVILERRNDGKRTRTTKRIYQDQRKGYRATREQA